ncbi:MAG TPA: PKD domain-containing protein [Thermoanaerobaculia bacterium]|jgi:hypothetical protein
MNYRVVASLLLVVSLLPAVGCDKATPVAPTGTILTISANPSKVGLNGQSTITVVGRKPDGNPLNPGTEIRLTTDKGTIDPVVTVGDGGVATAIFRADGRSGTAKITAMTGGGMTMATTDVQVGVAAGGVTLQATPSTISASDIPASGVQIRLLALVRDDQGQPLPDALVNFTTEIGTLDSRGAFRRTDARGQAEDRLTVREVDLASFSSPTFQVGVQATGGGGTSVSQDTFEVRIQRDSPVASFDPQPAGGNRVFFDNTTTGAEPITFEWDFNNDGTIDSNVREPTHDFVSAGTYTVRLVATNSAGSSTAIQTITVPVP